MNTLVKNIFIAATLSFSLFSFSSANAATIYVNAAATGANNGTNWTDAYTDLQSALTAAQAAGHDDIWVAKGTYKPSITDPNDVNLINGGKPTFLIPDDTNLYGGFAGTEGSVGARNLNNTLNKTVLDGDLQGNDVNDRNNGQYNKLKSDNVNHVITIINANVVVDGVTVKDGYAAGKESRRQARGGGMAIYNFNLPSMNVDIKNVNVQYNDALVSDLAKDGGDGGGIAAASPAPKLLLLNISDSILSNNSAGKLGGALIGFAGGTHVTITNTTISNNFAQQCGSIEIEDGSLQILDSTIENNYSAHSCSGIRITVLNAANASNSLIKHNKIRNNSGDDCGAVMLYNFSGTPTPSVTITDNDFENNVARNAIDSVLSCGVICNYSFDAVIDGNRFTGNSGLTGGAVCIINAGNFKNALPYTATVEIKNNQFNANNSSKGAGAVSVSAGQIVNIHDNSFEGNHTNSNGGAIAIDNASVSITNNNFLNNNATKYGDDIYARYAVPTMSGNTFAPGGSNSIVLK